MLSLVGFYCRFRIFLRWWEVGSQAVLLVIHWTLGQMIDSVRRWEILLGVFILIDYSINQTSSCCLKIRPDSREIAHMSFITITYINLKVSFLYRHYNGQKEKCQRVSITGLNYKGQIVAWNHIILIFKFYSY